MKGFKSELIEIEARIATLCQTIEDIRPTKGDLRWFAERKSALFRMRSHQGATDALNHAAAFLGYFDGYEARGAFQKRTKALASAKSVNSLQDLLNYTLWVMSEMLEVVQNLRARDPLILCEKGPKKPGPMRTAAVCKTHLESLEKTLCAVILRVAKSDDLRDKINPHLEN